MVAILRDEDQFLIGQLKSLESLIKDMVYEAEMGNLKYCKGDLSVKIEYDPVDPFAIPHKKRTAKVAILSDLVVRSTDA